VLASIQHQQQPSAGEHLRHTMRRHFAAAKIEPDRRGDRDGHEAGIGDWRELGQPHTIGKVRQQPASNPPRNSWPGTHGDAAGADG
jgi:hypothetical protein